jgi:hypothetical protein
MAARNGQAYAFAARPLLKDQRTKFRLGPRSENDTKATIKPRAQLRPVLIFPYPPADLQHCFRDAVGIPDRAPAVSEVEELWKQGPYSSYRQQAMRRAHADLLLNCLTSHHPNRRHPNRRGPCGSNSTAAEAEAKLDGSSRPHRNRHRKRNPPPP